jgi:CHAD domain-containing protein
MSHSLLHTYFKQRVKQVFNHLHDFDSSMSETDLHDFRVELKKMRAILKFLSKVYSKQKLKKSARLLSNIFQQAGDIREYQILLQWLDKSDMNELKNQCFPEHRMVEMIQHFQQQTHLFKLELKEVVDQLSDFIKSTNSILSEQYAIDLFAQINKIILKDCNASQWHDLRKRIKQWQYACNWVDEKDWNLEQAYFQKLQEAIGHWHDIETIQQNLVAQQKAYSNQIEVLKEITKANQLLEKSNKLRKREVQVLLTRKVISI